MVFSFFKFLFQAKNEHSLHSPFVFRLYTEVIRPKIHTEPSVFQEIEGLRKQFLGRTDSIDVLDLGAGSRLGATKTRKVRDVVRNAEKPFRFAQLLYRLVVHFQPKTIFDLGTSFGLTTLYLSKAKADGRVFTFEGCPETAKIAQQNFMALRANNVQVVVGNINETLPERLSTIESLDFAFFDANHRYEPTIRYFEQCLAKSHEDSVFVFDDIYWSAEMKQAWRHIKRHGSVSVTIDLFFIGIVIFRKKQPKQDFMLRF